MGKLRWEKVLPGEPTEVKKLIRGSWWSTKTTDSEKGVDLKNFFFVERPKEKIRRSNKSSVKLTVPGFVGSVQSKKLSRPSPPWTPKPAPDLSNAKWSENKLTQQIRREHLQLWFPDFESCSDRPTVFAEKIGQFYFQINEHQSLLLIYWMQNGSENELT